MAELPEEDGGSEPASVVEPISAAAAMAIGVRKGRARESHDPEFDAFLREQRRLISLQTEHMHEQRELILSRLRWGRFSDRLKALLQSLTVLIGLAVAAGVATVAWNAANDHAVVIDAFSVPPDLAEQGSTGAAVATQLHDKLLAMREATKTSSLDVSIREKAVTEARVEIPETGVSLGEVNRLLHDWLGHEQQVSGEVAHVTAGSERGALVMALRAADEPGARLVQADGDLDALLQKAAEHLYGAIQPDSFARWLFQHGRGAEAVAFATAMSGKGDPGQRAQAYYLLNAFSRDTLSPRQVRDLLAKAVALDPRMNPAWNDLAVSDQQLGQDELALQEFRRALKGTWENQRDDATADGLALVRSNIARRVADDRDALTFACRLARLDACEAGPVTDAFASGSVTSSWDDTIESRRWGLAQALVGLHDLRDADRIFAMPRPDFSRRTHAVRIRFDQLAVQAALAEHQAREDWPAMARDLAALDQIVVGRAEVVLREDATKALVLAKLGDAAGARTAAAALAPDCYPCLVIRGRVAEALGDRAEADRWFAEAVRQGPSLPQAEEAWGRARLARGDPDGAQKLAQEALRKSPHFADATELAGEAFLAKRDYGGAVRDFAEAAKLTPNWGGLHLKWGEALTRSGRNAEAQAHYQAAAGLALTPSERAALNAMQTRLSNGDQRG
jgi:tetratricopeptide (TPR) repeat protein